MSFTKAFEKTAVSLGEHPHLKAKLEGMRPNLPKSALHKHVGKAAVGLAILGAGGLALHHHNKKK